MRHKISESEIDINKKSFIYESPDGGKTIYRSDVDSRPVSKYYKPTAYDDVYDDVSGIKLDKPKEIDYISIYKKLELIEDKLDELIKRHDNN